MRTERIYYNDIDLVECDSIVLERTEWNGRPAVVLDKTVFYPEGGGQPCDVGEISGVRVVDVQERSEDILHVLDGSLPEVQGTVRCRIDGRRRRDLAEQHTGQHLLSAMTLRVVGGRTVSFHLGVEYSTIDVDLPELPRATADAIEDAAAQVIAENHTITIHVCPPESITDFPLRRPPPQGETTLRVVDMDGIDYSACCGTHLPNTARIGALHILRAEKYKGMTRIYFVAGRRARMDARRTAEIAREAARVLECSEDDVPGRTTKSIDRIKELETLVSKTRVERAEAEAKLFLLNAPKAGALEIPVSDRSYEEILESAKAVVAASGRPAMIGSRTALRTVVVAPDSTFKLGVRLKPFLTDTTGRGGGGPAQFQAQFPNEAAMKRFLESAHEELKD